MLEEDLARFGVSASAVLRAREEPGFRELMAFEVERARAVADVAGKIIESAKVEVSYMKEVGGKGSGFIPEAPRRAALEAPTNGAGRRQ